MANSEILKPFILSWEGGFANVSGDKGGATNRGVTIGTFRSVYGNHKTVADLKAMTDEQWTYIYKSLFWNKWKADSIVNQAIANLLVDWLWTSGSYGIRIPQHILRVTIDGIVGPKTLAAINGCQDQKALFRSLWGERQDFFCRIARGSQKKFLRGWLNRLDGIRYDRLVTSSKEIIRF